MGDLIKLRERIMQKIEEGDVKDAEHFDRLYRQYHRMRLWEATVITECGGRNCPHRN